MIPSGVKIIASYAFRNCKAATSVTIPEGVKAIGEKAFFGCSSLEEIVLPDSLERIGGTFSEDEMKSGNIDSKNNTEGGEVFASCTSLKTVIVGKNLEKVGVSVLDDCNALANVFYKGAVSDMDDVDIADGNDGIYAKLYFYSETEPEGEGLYWRYVSDVPTVWVIVGGGN